MVLGCQDACLASDDLQGLPVYLSLERELRMQTLQADLRLDSLITGGQSVQLPAEQQAPGSLTIVGGRQCSLRPGKRCVSWNAGAPFSLQA